MKIIILKVRIKLFETLRSRWDRFANLLKRRVINLSRIMAIEPMMAIERIWAKVSPKGVCWFNQSIMFSQVIAFAAFF
jgi:hypothetical protein